MDIGDFISGDALMASLRVATKEQALTELAKRAAGLSGRGEAEIFTALMEREALGSTGFGGGIAIPHAKLKGIDKIHGVLARLDRPIEFQAIDGQPVDLMCLLLAPATGVADHLKALACVSRLLRDPVISGKLRLGKSAADLFAALTTTRPGGAA